MCLKSLMKVPKSIVHSWVVIAGRETNSAMQHVMASSSLFLSEVVSPVSEVLGSMSVSLCLSAKGSLLPMGKLPMGADLPL